jgi:heme a synthase
MGFIWRETDVAAFGVRPVAARLTAPVLRPSRDSVRGFALASVIANAVLICTGAAVRLSSSGLGCPDWPRCTKTSVVAAHSAGQTVLNTAIEFGNRLLTKLNPAMVAVHFLLSSAILAAAVVLHVRAGEEAGPVRPLVRTDLRILAALLAAATALMLAAGTVVTGTGPLAGTIIDSGGHRTTVPRFRFPLQDVTQLHADIGWFIGALAVALVIGLRFTGAPAGTLRISRIVLGGLGVQGTIGYVQYFSHLPAGLVWLHVTISVALWIFVLRLYLSTRVRGPRLGKSAAVEATRGKARTRTSSAGASWGVSDARPAAYGPARFWSRIVTPK